MSALSFYFQVVKVLEEIGAPYMIVGAFGAQVFGLTRVTFDIDMLVALKREHIDALVARFPPPRYYADAEMIRNSIELGVMFNIIDTTEGIKVDLVPLTYDVAYEPAFARRIRQTFTDDQGQSFEAWCAQPTDIIIGKLRAWAEGRSSRHPNDIQQMLIFAFGDAQAAQIDLAEVERVATERGIETLALWHDLIARAAIEAQKFNQRKS